PEKARALGVDVTDPASVNAKLEKLQALRERARNWVSDPEIRDTAIAGYDSPADVIARLQETESTSGPKVEFQGAKTMEDSPSYAGHRSNAQRAPRLRPRRAIYGPSRSGSSTEPISSPKTGNRLHAKSRKQRLMTQSSAVE
ncbi:MAG TPA: hypothetical protein VF751_10380, partial [Chthoniobacterales bacterium]